MGDIERASVERKLDELSKRLRTRMEEIRRSGRFSDVHQALQNEIEQRNDRLRKRVKQAETDRSLWELIEAEVVRDYNALFDDLLQFEETLDTEFRKANKGSQRENSR